MISILKVFRNIRFFLQLFKYFLLIEISLLNFAAKKKKKKKKKNKKSKIYFKSFIFGIYKKYGVCEN